MTKFAIPDLNTRFALPIICPKTGEEVSAETLYNRACAALGYVVRNHIGDLILDNFKYGPEFDDSMFSTDDVYAWADTVRAQLP